MLNLNIKPFYFLNSSKSDYSFLGFSIMNGLFVIKNAADALLSKGGLYNTQYVPISFPWRNFLSIQHIYFS